ncbi:hypothetical protein [Verrucosispora sp. WMMC514]|uniref:hypothetical protein n=1 Tax=Verrucosispora sp. WMMC514 TaxID=3015156 RepID=UPI00248C16DC|nr:hypothetical protein [Verrucosispora sp. WMMC514]WBB91096.1 hypothetical protein O7597_29760 [Verrucosispora sp. WMMC514]
MARLSGITPREEQGLAAAWSPVAVPDVRRAPPAGPVAYPDRGEARRASVWRGDIAIELPGLATPVQLFVFGVVVSMWDAQAAAGAA